MRNYIKLCFILSLLLPGLLLSVKSQVCTTDVNGQTFAIGDGTPIPAGMPYTSTQPATDYGFTLDIYGLDDSFNMNINGTLLATQEIEFSNSQGLIQNIQFADGSKWQDGTIPAIWTISGSAATTPVVRVVISPIGTITMFGSKSSGGPLFPLALTNGNTFNTISWNTTGSNSVTITQNVVGPTRMSGYGSGKNRVSCHCTQSGATGTPGGFTKVGILTKSSITVVNWPQSVPNGHIVLDASDKGMVINHMNTDQRNALVPLEGMLIYNTDLNCVQLYRGNSPTIDAARKGWNCISRGCNENR